MMKKEQYEEITEFIKNYPRLAVECQNALKYKFPEVSPMTLGSILSKSGQNKSKQFHFKYSQRGWEFLER